MSIAEFISAESRTAPPPRRAAGRIAPPALPAIAPGQIWLVELPADGGLSAPLGRALAAANVVIYDRALGDAVAGVLPLGNYAEPAAAQDAAAARCVHFARDGWSVVRLLPARLPQRERTRRVQDLIDGLAFAGVAGALPVAVLAAAADGVEEHVAARFDDLAALVASHPRDTRLAVVIAAFGGGAAARLHAVAANGLAG